MMPTMGIEQHQFERKRVTVVGRAQFSSNSVGFAMGFWR
jgi:hypothetical protein